MLIIFDLDDTLIDTSGSVTPFKLRFTLEKLEEAGLKLTSFEEEYKRLLTINEKSRSGKEALKTFLEEIKKESYYPFAMLEMQATLPESFSVQTLTGAKEVLEDLSKNYLLGLVTIGDELFQRDKLKKSGIDSSLFSKIAIVQSQTKKEYYERFLKEYKKNPSEVVVCGDRIITDLLPAKELGLFTIHVEWGRGGSVKEPREAVDFRVKTLREIPKIIRGLHDYK